MVNWDWGHTGQNYLRSLFALGVQAFLIIALVNLQHFAAYQLYFYFNIGMDSSTAKPP